MQRVVVDANAFLSTLVHRNDKQRDAAKAYGIPGFELALMLRGLIALPGVLVIDECPWKRVLEYWPPPKPE